MRLQESEALREIKRRQKIKDQVRHTERPPVRAARRRRELGERRDALPDKCAAVKTHALRSLATSPCALCFLIFFPPFLCFRYGRQLRTAAVAPGYRLGPSEKLAPSQDAFRSLSAKNMCASDDHSRVTKKRDAGVFSMVWPPHNCGPIYEGYKMTKRR